MLLHNEFFTTKVEVDYEGSTSNVELKWGIDPEMRSWGIKSLGVYVLDQKIAFCITVENPDTGDEEDKDIELTIGGECKVEYAERSHNADICPYRIEVWKGKITVLF